MKFKKGDLVKLNKDYIQTLYEEEKDTSYGDITSAINHIKKGNNPVRIAYIHNNDEYRLEGINGYTQYTVIKKEIIPLKNNIKKL